MIEIFVLTMGVCEFENCQPVAFYESERECNMTPIFGESNAATCLAFLPCETEDSNNCYWDALEMGNGVGRSFLNMNGKLYTFQPLI